MGFRSPFTRVVGTEARDAMDVGPVLWLFMTLGGAALLGLAIAYALISTRRRRANWWHSA